MPNPPRTTVFSVGAYANPKRGPNVFPGEYNPRRAPAGIDWKKALVDPSTRPCSAVGTPLPARISPLNGFPEPGTTVPAVVIVTAFERSYRAGTKFAMLFAIVYMASRYSYRKPISKLSLRLTFQLSCINAAGCVKRKNPTGSALASV